MGATKNGAPSGVLAEIVIDVRGIPEVQAGLAVIADLTAQLDTLLNGVPTGATLGQLVDLVRMRQSVQIVNLADGMRLNCRAPDGRRATVYLDVVNEQLARGEPALAATVRAAIADYPLAGEPLPFDDQRYQGRVTCRSFDDRMPASLPELQSDKDRGHL